MKDTKEIKEYHDKFTCKKLHKHYFVNEDNIVIGNYKEYSEKGGLIKDFNYNSKGKFHGVCMEKVIEYSSESKLLTQRDRDIEVKIIRSFKNGELLHGEQTEGEA